MSTSVTGIRDLDGRFCRMIEIKKCCDDIRITYPTELVAYFGEHGAGESTAYLREQMETIDINAVVVVSGDAEQRRYEVDLSKLSAEVKAIRFMNSW